MTTVSSPESAGVRPAMAVAALLAVGVAALLVRHIAGYFFLIDDYALVSAGLTSKSGDMLSQPLFGFYRPAAFLFVRLETLAYGWASPWAFAATSVVLHAINAWLVCLLTGSLARDRSAGWLAGGLFLASPWSAEAFLWVSGRFDLLATGGVLATLVVACWARERAGRLVIALPLAFVLSCVAVASKEHAVVLPVVLAALAVCLAHPPGGRMRLFALGAASGCAVAAYLFVRQGRLPGLDGAYGSLGDLVARTDVPGAAALHLRGLVWWPLPMRDPIAGITVALVLVPALAILFPALAWFARRQWGLLTVCAVLALLSLSPVVWAPLSGRFLYLPGVWCAVGGGVCLAHWLRAPTATRWSGRFSTLGLPIFVVFYAVVSVQTQVGWWGRASAMARNGIGSFAPLVDGDAAVVHIANLPFRCIEGPVVLTSYAFGYYYRGHRLPAIRSTAHMVTCEGEASEQLAGFPDPLTDLQQPQPGEREVRLDLE